MLPLTSFRQVYAAAQLQQGPLCCRRTGTVPQTLGVSAQESLCQLLQIRTIFLL